VSSDTVVVGAYYTYNKDFKGSAYVFQRDRGGTNAWGQVKHLVSNDLARGDYFGADVSIHRDTVVVSAIYDTVGSNLQQGSAYVFQRHRGGTNTWGQLRKLTASDGATSSDYFGASVAVSGSTVVIGAPLNDLSGKTDKGTVYVFE
jgi:FG-GAP repeat